VSEKSVQEALIQGLPYIQALRGKTIVVKYGGNAMINAELKASVIKDIVFLHTVGIPVILVHGGGPEIEAMLRAVGKESRFVNGLRYTDEETMSIVQMVLCGKVNKEITALLEAEGVHALGICGIDGALFQAERENKLDLGFVGKIKKVNVNFLRAIMQGCRSIENDGQQDRIIPVISSVALGVGADKGLSLNVNADTAAALTAEAIKAEKLILMTDVAGLLRDIQNPESLIREANLADIDKLKKEGAVSKGMVPKLDCCEIALLGGVKAAHIIDGRVPHGLLAELFGGERIGTMICHSDFKKNTPEEN
jgi:acetylglutamate kinase